MNNEDEFILRSKVMEQITSQGVEMKKIGLNYLMTNNYFLKMKEALKLHLETTFELRNEPPTDDKKWNIMHVDEAKLKSIVPSV